MERSNFDEDARRISAPGESGFAVTLDADTTALIKACFDSKFQPMRIANGNHRAAIYEDSPRLIRRPSQDIEDGDPLTIEQAYRFKRRWRGNNLNKYTKDAPKQVLDYKNVAFSGAAFRIREALVQQGLDPIKKVPRDLILKEARLTSATPEALTKNISVFRSRYKMWVKAFY